MVWRGPWQILVGGCLGVTAAGSITTGFMVNQLRRVDALLKGLYFCCQNSTMRVINVRHLLQLKVQDLVVDVANVSITGE